MSKKKDWVSTKLKPDLHQAIKQFCVVNKLPFIETVNNWLEERILQEAGGVKE